MNAAIQTPPTQQGNILLEKPSMVSYEELKKLFDRQFTDGLTATQLRDIYNPFLALATRVQQSLLNNKDNVYAWQGDAVMLLARLEYRLTKNKFGEESKAVIQAFMTELKSAKTNEHFLNLVQHLEIAVAVHKAKNEAKDKG